MKNENTDLSWLRNTLGPGVIFASTAIGVSHLVQSTRAGADYGFGLLIFVIIANLLKYPFFEFSSRYASVTGTSIIEGYNELGKYALWSYLIITLFSMLFITSAVGAVTAGFLQNLFNTSEYGMWNHLVILCICGLTLSLGKYDYLDRLIKIIGAALLLSTIVAFILILLKGPMNNDLIPVVEYNRKDIFFIIALMGWMPTAVDLSSWNSLWVLEKIKLTKYRPLLSQTLFEFNIGYISAAILAVCFVTLGAYLMYGTDISFSESSALFANQVINLYTESIGSWSYLIISASGFSIMFGTCIAVFDGYARSTCECIRLVQTKQDHYKFYYDLVIWLLVVGTCGIIYFFGSKIKQLVDLATTISFLIAPIVAMANYRLVNVPYLSKDTIPPFWLRSLAVLGIIYLSLFSIIFIYFKII